MTPEQDAVYREALRKALDAGAKVLREGGTAMDAIQAAIEPMEDDPLFNAGRGAVFTWDGDIELDASIMDGRTRDAGAIAGVRGPRPDKDGPKNHTGEPILDVWWGFHFPPFCSLEFPPHRSS